MYTQRDFVNSTCFIESPFIKKDKSSLKVLNLCLDYSNIHVNSVLDLLRASFFAINHSETLVNSLFMFSSNRVTSLLAKVKCVSSAYILGCEIERHLGKSFI